MGHGRQDQFDVTLIVDNVDYGTWSNRTGGNREAESTVHKPGGMRDPIALGGSPMTDAVVLRKLTDPDTEAALHALVGKGRAKVTSQPLDESGIAYKRATVWEGVLSACRPAEHDANSQDEAMLEVEVAVEKHGHA